jgi:NADPH:quinone reductase-like Zn-dependent oxidoreductase
VRALTISKNGGTEQIEVRNDLPMPDLRGPGDVRIRVSAAALNHLDLFVIGGLPGVKLAAPFILGSDACGVIDAVGDDVKHVTVGDYVILNPGMSDGTCEYCLDGEQPLCPRYRILGEHVPGTMAEYVVLPGKNAHTIPRSVSSEQGAAFPLATLTAWRMLVSRARVKPGEDVLIWGIGGGVALAALQICKNIGARVWVVSSSDAKLERAAAMGADELLNRNLVDVAKVIREKTAKRGMDVVVDNVGQATWSQSLLALGRRGRLVTCGGTSGPTVETDVRRLFWNQWSLLGSTMGNDAEFEAITNELRAGRLLPPVDSVFSLDDGRLAFERLEKGEQFGKVVVRIS